MMALVHCSGTGNASKCNILLQDSCNRTKCVIKGTLSSDDGAFTYVINRFRFNHIKYNSTCKRRTNSINHFTDVLHSRFSRINSDVLAD